MGRAFMVAACVGTIAGWPLSSLGQSSGASIVEEALKGVEQDQARDAERVRRMVDEAVKGTEQAPSGQEAVNPSAPDSLVPLPDDAAATLPAEIRSADLVGKPVHDAAGARIGEVKALVLDEASGAARAMVELAATASQPGKVAAVPVEALVPAARAGDGYVMDMPVVALEQLPAYAWRDERWQRIGT